MEDSAKSCCKPSIRSTFGQPTPLYMGKPERGRRRRRELVGESALSTFSATEAEGLSASSEDEMTYGPGDSCKAWRTMGIA
jgi:hypothetical protein